MGKFFKNTILIFTILSLWFLSLQVAAQDSKTLEKKRKGIQNEINIINRSLSKTLKEKKSSSEALAILKMQIRAREKLIKTINEEVQLLQIDIKSKTNQSNSLKNQLKLMKLSYAKTIQQAQYSRNIINKLVFIFSAKDFNQAYKRMQYFSQLASYRRAQANEINDKTKELDNKLAQIAKNINNKNYLVNSKIKEKRKLDISWQQQNKIVKQLQSEESKLRKDLAKKQKDQKSLNEAIQRAIKREIQLAKQKTASKKSTSKSLLASTPAALELSAKFLENKGKLPWPVSFGQIVEQFGTHPHPSLKKVKTNTIGVNIKTISGSNIMSVFNGDVIAVQLLYGRYAVIIQHGEYFTTYANLISVNVKRGGKVKTNQVIGKASINPEGLSEIQFIVNLGSKNIYPVLWLAYN
ncbi:MAG: murein hydrolase activator EnvC family protein [Solitalea-like symbiont of Acarus siro]